MANPFIKVREQIVNDVTSGNQRGQAVSTSAAGDVIVSWQDTGTWLQVFDSHGSQLSPEISGLVARPPVWLADGSFAAFVQSGSDILVNRYLRDGTLLDTSGPVGPSHLATGLVPLSSGNLVAVFDSNAQILDAALDPVGPAFHLASADDRPFLFEPLADGGFLAYGGDSIQRYSATGTQVFLIPSDALDVAALPDGGFIAVTHRLHTIEEPGDGNSWGIIATIYNADGSVRVADFVANTSTFGEQSYPSVEVLGDDLLVVTWLGMQGQLFNSSGRKIGSEINLDNTGFAGWRFSLFGWSTDAHGVDGFVTASVVTGTGQDVELTYWGIDRGNILIGDASGETFDGGGSAERIMVGFGGDDLFNVDSAGDEVQEAVGEGSDTIRTIISFAIAAGQEIEVLQTTNNIGTSPLALTGNALSQYIFGNYGANLIDGGGGGDTLLGFAGDDTYVVRDPFDQVRENAGEGFDRINGTVSYGLLAGQEVEMLAFANNIGTEAFNVTGNEFGQYLYGNYGNNLLNGGGGADVMSGFLGDDTYFVDHSGDDVRENAGEGNDRIVTSASFVLGAGQAVEIIETSAAAGTAALEIAGNALAQTITGNAGNNVLTGGGGADVLVGLGGDDIYFITPDAILQEAAGGGSDRVFVSGSYTLAGSEIEVLTPTDEFGTDPFNLTGNSFGQYVYGNDGANRLDGGGGGDVLVGRGGDDLLFVRNASDQIREDANDGFDRALANTSWRLNANARVEMVTTDDNLGTAPINLAGNEFAQYVYGNAGNNTIGGAGGKDVLNGLGGSDFFLFDTALNTTFTSNFAGLADTANVDRIDGFAADDRIALSGALFGFTPGALPAGAFNTGTTATDADDRILWDAASRTLLFDPDGTGAQAAQMIAVLSDPFNLDASFIIVV